MGLKRGEAGLAGCPTNEWQDSNPERFSVGRNRAGRGSGSPLAFHILVTQMALEDWRNGLKVGRQRLIRAVCQYYAILSCLLAPTYSSLILLPSVTGTGIRHGGEHAREIAFQQ